MVKNSPLQNTHTAPHAHFTHYAQFGGFTGFLLAHYVRTLPPKCAIRTQNAHQNARRNPLIYKIMRKIRIMRTSPPMCAFWRV